MPNTQAIGGQVGLAVAQKALQIDRQQGEAAVALVKDAAEYVQAPRGAVSAAPGAQETGQRLDTQA